MDPLQLALIILILLLVGFLSVMGIQVFLILKDLRKELNKIDKMLTLIEHHGFSIPQVPSVQNVIAQAQIPQPGIRGNHMSHPPVEKEPRRLFRRKS